MTPKEKAENLALKYHNLWINGNSIMAKHCALISVDEILNEQNEFMQTNEHYKYWQKVKQEIEKL
jgi:hypothetical protein